MDWWLIDVLLVHNLFMTDRLLINDWLMLYDRFMIDYWLMIDDWLMTDWWMIDWSFFDDRWFIYDRFMIDWWLIHYLLIIDWWLIDEFLKIIFWHFFIKLINDFIFDWRTKDWLLMKWLYHRFNGVLLHYIVQLDWTGFYSKSPALIVLALFTIHNKL